MDIPDADGKPPDRLRFVVLTLATIGLVGLALTTVTSFEQPNDVLLAVSAAFVLAAPAAVFIHLWQTRDLTREEKRTWWRQFASARGPSALSAYLSANDRRVALQQFLASRS